MNKFLEIIAKFAELENISASQAKELDKVFSELPEDDQKENATKDLYDNARMKFNDGSADDDDDADNGVKDDGGDNGGDEADVDADANDDDDDSDDDEEDSDDNIVNKIEATEPDVNGMVSLKASELAILQSTAALVTKMARDKKEAEFGEKVNALCFSESNPNGIVLPKTKDKVKSFAMGLSEKQAAKFFNIIKELKIVASEEIGHGKNTKKDEKVGNISKSEAVKYYTENLGMTREKAEKTFAEMKKQESQ